MRAKVAYILLLSTLVAYQILGQVDNSYYLPEVQYDPVIPDPQSVLGFQVGEWHLSHDQIIRYAEKLCASSSRCQFVEYARTHEARPLINLVISSPKNLKNSSSILETRNAILEGKSDKDLEDLPLILYQGYSVHGNESSGANAAMMVAYYLCAGHSNHLDKLLEETIILIDPCLNPDGLQRFSTWANMHKHATLTTDPRSREFNEVWPGGRTNHYWFDLNRDWIFNIHPSSKGRIETFQKWKPDILTDHHEMGSNSTFFFQPGVPSRTNPNTPEINQILTEDISKYHESYLDSIGSKYFSKKRFDDFYYGKGSTYPDINGSVGILFEQASARGHLRESKNGLLSFPFTIRNQVVTSLSTQKGALDLKNKILGYKLSAAQRFMDDKSCYSFSVSDKYKEKFFLDLLDRHDIKVYPEPVINKKEAVHSKQYLVPLGQRQGGLVKTIFEPVDQFQDSIFYDVSAWTLPYAFDLPYEKLPSCKVAEELPKLESKGPESAKNPEGLIHISWKEYNAPALAYQAISDSLEVLVAHKENRALGLSPGDLIINLSKENTTSRMREKLLDGSIDFTPFKSSSMDSSMYKPLSLPKVALLVGKGINAYEAGHSWYQLDQRLKMPVTLLDNRLMDDKTLYNKYDVIILPDGKYDENARWLKNLKAWAEKGGTLITMRGAISLMSKLGWTALEKKSTPQVSTSFSKLVNDAQKIGGAIFGSEIDINDPLFYGYEKSSLPVFKKGTDFYVSTQDSIATPMQYSIEPLLSGYVSKANLELAANAVAVAHHPIGDGYLIMLVDNPNFRGYWLGGSRLFSNCILMSQLLKQENSAKK